MANTIKLGNGNWATKEGSLLAYNDENNNFKPLPFTTTRASSATVVNKQGLIETVGSGIPRIDFSDDANGALLLEPTATNLFTYSEAFDNAIWFKSGATSVATVLVNPSGGSQSYLLSSTSSSTNDIRQNCSFAASTTYSYSIFIKEGTSQEVRMQVYDGNSFYRIAVNPVSDFSVVDQSGLNSYLIEDFSNGWKRVSINITTSASAGSGYSQVYPDRTGNLNNTYIFGAQLEQKSYATSYIKTVGTTQTRVADTANLSNLTSRGLLNNSAMVLYFENDIQSNTIDSYKEVIALYSDAYNAGFRLETRVNNQVYVQQDSLISSGDNFSSFTLGANSVNFKKIAVYITTTQFKVFADGSQVGSTFNGVYTLNFNNIGFRRNDLAVESVIKTKDVRVYNTALSDAELTSLTTI